MQGLAVMSHSEEKGITLQYRMTYQISLTGANSLWSTLHHNFMGGKDIHIYKWKQAAIVLFVIYSNKEFI